MPPGTTIMTIGGFDLGPDYPTIAQVFDNVRPDEQGPGFRRHTLTLSGFIEGCDSSTIFTAYEALKAVLQKNIVEVNITVNGVSLHDSRKMYVQSFTEPDEWKEYIGEYTIVLYWFAAITDSNNTTNFGVATFNGYTFQNMPTFGRSISTSRISYADESNKNRKLVTVSISGFVTVNGISAGTASQEAMENTFWTNGGRGVLAYGSFSQTVQITKLQFSPVTPRNQYYFDAEFEYFSGDIINISAKRTSSRIHSNPVIDQRPFCGDTEVQSMGSSGQEVTWDIQVRARTIDLARAQLATEIASRVSGGIEMPGGSQVDDESNGIASASITRFFVFPVIGNLG